MVGILLLLTVEPGVTVSKVMSSSVVPLSTPRVAMVAMVAMEVTPNKPLLIIDRLLLVVWAATAV